MRKLFRRFFNPAPKPSLDPWPLGRPLLRFGGQDYLTIGNALENFLILGATGSAKTSGSGRALALGMLMAGFGGIVLTAKPTEREEWETYCREAGRSSDLLVFGPNEPLRFNFMNYELARPGAGAGLIENLVSLFSTIFEIAERTAGSGGGREDEGYWRRACRQLLRCAIDLLVMATGSVSIPDLYRLIITAPMSPTELRNPEWQAKSFCFQCMQAADKVNKSEQARRDYGIICDYFLIELPGLSEKTRSVIISTFTSMADLFLRGMLRDLFCGATNVTPDTVAKGKILLIDMPIKGFNEVGQIAQVIWKYTFQRAIERRDVRHSPRPVFLWMDEAQNFLTSHDMQFLTTCRSARAATVLISQNVSNFYAVLGGNDKGRAEADSIFANCNTKVFHANADNVTNQWASELIGRTLQSFANGNNTQSDDWVATALGFGGSGQTSGGFSESFELEVQPSRFTQLRTGGVAHDRYVDAIVVQNGRLFKTTGRNWMPVTFRQTR